MIKLTNVNKYFNKGRQNEIHVINDVSLDLPATGLVALFGKSGCGKTTLLNAVGGLDRIASGSIEIDGKTIAKNTDEIRNRYMGYIFQNYNLNMLVDNYENVAEALRLCGMTDEEEINKRVTIALKNVGLEKYIKRMPDTLSGGQKQRIAIARAIVKNPAIILADEPTGNLDEKNTLMIMNLLKALSKDHLILLVTHEANLVDLYCDQVIELKDGKIVSTRKNEAANGYVAREKNVVYLGEYEKQEQTISEGVNVEYYGMPCPNVKIQLVNQNGVLLLKVAEGQIRLLDETSEVVFKEGSFEEVKKKEDLKTKVDLTELPTVTGTKYGKLFHWNNSLKGSVKDLVSPKKKSSRALRRVMLFFALLLTLMVALLARNVKEMIKADESYNHNTFYLYAPTKNAVRTIIDTYLAKEKGMDFIELGVNRRNDDSFGIDFEIFESYRYEGSMFDFDLDGGGSASPVKGHGVLLPNRLLEGKAPVAGRINDLKEDDLVISKRLADMYLANSNISIVKKYRDLIGLGIQGLTGRIVGIVDVEEPAVYVDVYRNILKHNESVKLVQDDIEITADHDYTLAPNEVIIRQAGEFGNEAKEGDVIQLMGRNFTVKKIVEIDWTQLERHFSKETGMEVKILDASLSDIYMDEDGNWRTQIGNLIVDIWDHDMMEIEGHMYCLVVQAKLEGFEQTENILFTEPEVLRWYLANGKVYLVSKEAYENLYYMDMSESEAMNFRIHSSDIEKTREYLEKFAVDNRLTHELMTPQQVKKDKMTRIKESMRGQLIACGVISALLFVCMYMIMRSNLMSRVKEVGVYRCIGVSKKNLTFKYAIEAFALTALAVVPGNLLVLGVIAFLKYGSPLAVDLFMPVWIALPLLAVLVVTCVFCGTLPTMLLLRKTPSEIMAKYDV